MQTSKTISNQAGKSRINGKTLLALSVCAPLTWALTGCGSGVAGGTQQASQTEAKGTISGRVYGGQSPVIGSTIQLYAVGTSGPKSASTALIASTVLSDSNGNFSITNDYSCTSPVAATQVYIVATGGNSGSGTNSALAMMSLLGDCATLKQNAATTSINIDELSTVAAAYVLSPFMSDIAHVGATGTNPPALLNATANFNNLVNLAAGTIGGASLPAGATLPVAELNTLGDILAACVNTAGSTSSQCQTLFTATGATNTIGAALAFPRNPGSSTLTALVSLLTPAAPFQPNMSAAPNDWTVAIKYNAGGTLSAPYGIAIDASGNAWVTNTSGTAVTKLNASGSVAGNFSGATGARGIAIDRSGNVWIADGPLNSVVKMDTNGNILSGSAGYTGSGLSGPTAIAIDSAGNAWVANFTGNSVTELSSTGTPTSANGSTGFTAGGSIAAPTGIALDSSGNVYVSNNSTGGAVKLTNAGAVASGSPFSDFALQGASSLALDASNNVWVPGSTTGSAVAGAVSQYSSAGAASSNSPLAGGGLLLPGAVATAGTSIWVTDIGTGSLTQLISGQASPVSPAAGFGTLSAPVGVAVDASGNVWTANSGDNTVSVFLGLSSTVVTPIAANVGP